LREPGRRRRLLLWKLKREIETNALLIDQIGGECFADAMLRHRIEVERRESLRPYFHKLAPVELRPDGKAPEEFLEHVPKVFRAAHGKGIPIDSVVSEIAAGGHGFSGETWDELAGWLEDNVKTEARAAGELADAKAGCSRDVQLEAPELIRRIEKAQRLLDRLEGCTQKGRGACLGRVRLAIERNLSRKSAMRRYWREIRGLARHETAG